MKKAFLVIGLLVGMVGLSRASSAGNGWKAYTISKSSAQVFIGAGFLGSMYLSSACNVTDFAVAFDTVTIDPTTGFPTAASNSTVLSYSAAIGSTVTQVTPFLLYGSSLTTGGSAPAPISGVTYWSPGQAPGDFVEIMNGLFVYKNQAAFGGCDQVTVYYRR